jgi:mono/diheme cytochrome c family protein
MKRILRWIVGIIVLIVIVVVAVSIFVYSGIANVSAIPPDSRPVAWLLDTAMAHSVQRHARSIQVPPLDDPAMVKVGFAHYREMCAGCHGAPGINEGETAQGLRPSPPRLTETAGDWKPNELFWITKNGVRMTGMPAWGITHTDDDIWAIVSFTRKLPTLIPAEYKTLDTQVPRTAEH